MLRRLKCLLDLSTRAHLARRETERWLTWAMGQSSPSLPRIPAKQVSMGGFDHILNSPDGREWSDAWWQVTLNNVQLDSQ